VLAASTMDKSRSLHVLIDLERLELVTVVSANGLLMGVAKETDIHVVDVPEDVPENVPEVPFPVPVA
jgi:hypothetical protein